jgi:hypothetical protein
MKNLPQCCGSGMFYPGFRIREFFHPESGSEGLYKKGIPVAKLNKPVRYFFILAAYGFRSKF